MNKKVLCPICHNFVEQAPVIKTTLNVNLNFDVIQCNKCETYFFNPLPSKIQLEAHYTSDYGFYKADNSKALARGLGFSKKFLNPKVKGNFLDIGCASGDFLKGIEYESGWNVFGTDINEQVIKEVKSKLNLDVRVGEIHTIGFDNATFDFIHVRDVLEHVTDPLSFMTECRRIIKKNGVLYLSVPNGVADIQNMINFYKKFDSAPASNAGHIYFFSQNSLNYIFESCGFTIEKAYSYGFKNGLRAFGLYPNKRNWKLDMTPYQLRASNTKDLKQPTSKHRSKLYRQLKFHQAEFSKIPGLYKFAHDYIFLLKPI